MKRPNPEIGKICLPTEQYDPGKSPTTFFRYIDIASIDKENKSIIGVQRILGQDAPSRARKVVRAGDVLVSTVRPNLNAVTIVPAELNGEVASTGFCVLRPNPKLVESRYLFYRTVTTDFVRYLVARMKGANYPAVTDGTVKQAKIPLPSPSEQQRIIEILDQADQLRKLRAEADKKAERVLPALFNKMFGDAESNSKGWETDRLGKLVEFIDYGLSEKLSLVDTAETGIPIIRISNVLQDGNLNLEDLRYWPADENLISKLKLEKGDLLFNWRNGSQEHIGKTAIWENEATCIFVSFLLRIRCGNKKLRPYFLWTMMNILRSKGFFSRSSRMQINSKFNATELGNLQVISPDIDLQTEFEKTVINIRKQQIERQSANKQLEKIFSSLLNHAFSGTLTASWREAHMKELLAEMEQQAKYLN